MSQIKLRQLGKNLLIINGEEKETIVFPEKYNFDRIFSLAYKANEGSNTALNLLKSILSKYRKTKEISPIRLEKKKIDKEIKILKTFDYNTLPINIPKEWLDVLNNEAENTHIKNFLLLLSMNPNEYTRNNFLKRLTNNYPYITSMGYLVLTRQVWKNTGQKDELYDAIQSSYVKIKGQKKGPKNYGVYTKGEEISISTIDPDVKEKGWDYEGNLEILFRTYTPEIKTTYYSNYNKNNNLKESWSLGDVVIIKNPDFSNEICGTDRLHVKTSPFSNVGNKTYGDTTVIVLVNPRDVISIREDWKLTCSQFKICAVVTDDEIKSTFTKDFEHWAYDYATEDVGGVHKSMIKDLIDKKKNLEPIAKNFTVILQNRINTI